MPLTIRHLSLRELLTQPLPFRMARYQRHYEWTRREMEDLHDDLGDAFQDHKSEPARGAFHFLGNIILFPNDQGQLEVVDGQQRLTSISILLAAARDLAADPALASSITPLLTAGAAASPRLTLHRGDQEFFEANVLPQGATKLVEGMQQQAITSAEHIRTNTIAARRWFAGLPIEDQSPLIEFILSQGRCVEISVGTEDDAFRIFETVNSRGRPINSEDVLRYALVEYATDDPAVRDSLLSRWDDMESELGPRGMKRFIAGWRARVMKGGRPRQPIHRILLGSFKTQDEAFAFLNTELSGDLSVFKEINTADTALPDGPDKRRIDTIFRSLALVDFDEWLPVAQELLTRQRATPQRLAADLERLERLAWYFYLNRDDKGIYLDRRDRFSNLMKTVTSAGTLSDLPPTSILSLENRAKMRDIVQSRLDPKWVPLRSLLVRLEMAMAGDGVRVNREDLTIEHVLPLRPKTKAWLGMFNNDQAVVTQQAERVGNLCLVSHDLNTRLGNLTFANKKKMMLADGIPSRSPLAADVGTEKNWTREVIDRRSKRFVQVICDTFGLQEKE